MAVELEEVEVDIEAASWKIAGPEEVVRSGAGPGWRKPCTSAWAALLLWDAVIVVKSPSVSAMVREDPVEELVFGVLWLLSGG